MKEMYFPPWSRAVENVDCSLRGCDAVQVVNDSEEATHKIIRLHSPHFHSRENLKFPSSEVTCQPEKNSSPFMETEGLITVSQETD
jgi:hypothetical protein